MTGEQSLILRGLAGVSLGACSVLSWKIAPRLRISSRSFTRLFMAAYAASRLGLFTVVMLVLHIAPRGDINLYMQEAAPALAGKLVYRDFITPHAPLDPYLLGSMLRLHNSPLTIIFFAIVFDILTIFIWLKAAQFFLNPVTLRRAALLVLFNPTSLLTESIDGQMNALIALFLALGVYALVVRRDFLSGLCVALPTTFVKFLALIYAPGYLFASRRKLVASVGFLAAIVAVYGSFAFAGANLAVPLHAEGAHKTAGNLVFLWELVTGRTLGLRLPDIALGLSWLFVVCVTYFAMRRVAGSGQSDRRQTCYLLTVSLIAELLCVQVFSKNTWDRYLVMAMFPLCVLVAEMNFLKVFAFGIYAADVVWEPSYWATSMQLVPALDLHAGFMAGDPRVCRLVMAECIDVAVGLFLLATCIRTLLEARDVFEDQLPEPVSAPST
jgi:hypothetical protein